MTIKKPYIQIRKFDDDTPEQAMTHDWILIASNSVEIATSSVSWYSMTPCKRSAHRAGRALSIEVRNEK